MGKNRFVPLHNHSQYSFLDGWSTVEGMADKAKELGMSALGLTDHGEVSGHVAFQDACERVGIKPIFGMEGYLVDDTKRVREEKDRVNSHLCLFAETQEGLSNLWSLSTEAYFNKYYKPLADWEILSKYSKGLIVSDGCMMTNISRNILKDRMDEAKEIIARYLDIMGEENFFMELHTWQFTDPGDDEESLQLNREMSKINQGKVEIATEMGVPLIVVNDSHFTEEEDWHDHDLVWAMSTNSDQTERGKTAAWIMSDEEIYYWMSKHGVSRKVTEEAIKNTSLIAERCFAEIRPQTRTPNITGTAEGDLELYNKKVEDGFRRKVLEAGKSEEEVQRYRERMEYENSLIIDKEFYGYFNVVADYTKYAKMADPEGKNGPIKGKEPWLVGPARGSAGGTLIAYLMDITEIDPMEYGLMFERFLTRGRGARVTINTDQGTHKFVIGDKIQLTSGEIKLVQNLEPGDDVDLEATSRLNL